MGQGQARPRLGTADWAQASNLLRSMPVPSRVPMHFWSVFWDAPDSATQIFSLIQPETVREIISQHPRNLARLLAAVRCQEMPANPRSQPGLKLFAGGKPDEGARAKRCSR